MADVLVWLPGYRGYRRLVTATEVEPIKRCIEDGAQVDGGASARRLVFSLHCYAKRAPRTRYLDRGGARMRDSRKETVNGLPGQFPVIDAMLRTKAQDREKLHGYQYVRLMSIIPGVICWVGNNAAGPPW